MSIKILIDGRDKIAAIYDSTREVALGPMFTETNDVDASDLAKKFLDWVQPDVWKMAPATQHEELIRRRGMFMAIGWKECPWSLCVSTIIMEKEVGCEACLHACGICYKEDLAAQSKMVVQTYTVDGLDHQKRVLACYSCQKMLNVRLVQ